MAIVETVLVVSVLCGIGGLLFPVGSTVRLYVHPDGGTPAYRQLPELTTIIALTMGGVLFLAIAAVAAATAL